MNNCVNFDVVFIKWYLRRMTECSCRLLPNAFWFLNLASLALFFGLFPSSIFLSLILSIFLSFIPTWNLHTQSRSIVSECVCFFQVWLFDEIVLQLTEQQQQQHQKQETAFFCNHKICSLCSTVHFSFFRSGFISFWTFIYVHNFMKFVCLPRLICFVCRWSRDLLFFFDFYICIHQSRLFRRRSRALIIVCQVQFSIFFMDFFLKMQTNVVFSFLLNEMMFEFSNG